MFRTISFTNSPGGLHGHGMSQRFKITGNCVSAFEFHGQFHMLMQLGCHLKCFWCTLVLCVLLIYGANPRGYTFELRVIVGGHTCAWACMTGVTGWRGFRGFLGKLICCYMRGPRKQYFQVDVIVTHFSFWTSGNFLKKESGKLTFLAPTENGVFLNLNKDMFLFSQRAQMGPRSGWANGLPFGSRVQWELVSYLCKTQSFIWISEIPHLVPFTELERSG